MPQPPQVAPSIWPLLRAAGFTLREIAVKDGSPPRPPLRMYYHFTEPGHLVVVLECEIQRPGGTVRFTELAVYPELSDLAVATRRPAERARARFFATSFDARTPVAVVGAAAIAALSTRVPRRTYSH